MPKNLLERNKEKLKNYKEQGVNRVMVTWLASMTDDYPQKNEFVNKTISISKAEEEIVNISKANLSFIINDSKGK